MSRKLKLHTLNMLGYFNISDKDIEIRRVRKLRKSKTKN